MHAACESPPAAFGIVPRTELTIRRATLDDISPLVELERVLPLHLAESPVFSRLPGSPPEEIVAELESDIVDPKYEFLWRSTWAA